MSERKAVALPEDPEAEKALLGAILLGGVQTFTLAHSYVAAGDLTRDAHRVALAAMEHLAERGDAIDYSSVASEMERIAPHAPGVGERHDAFLVGLFESTPSFAHVETYAKRIRYCATSRRLAGVANEFARIAYAQSEDDEAGIMGRAQAAFEQLLTTNAGASEILDQKQLAMQYVEILERRQARDPDVIGISTGFPDLDDYAMLKPGELWYVAGSPTAGKTSLLTNIQEDLAYRGVPSLFVSLEQPPVQLMDRIIADAAKIDGSRLARGALDAAEWERVNAALARRIDRPAYLQYRPGINSAQLAALCQLAKVRHGIKVAFVDYVQLLGDESDESETVRVSDISRRLMYLSGRLQICVIAACQVSRKGVKPDGSPPELSDLRQSGTLEQDAFVVVALGRKPDSENVIDVIVRKNRNGPSGPLQLYFDRAHTRFQSLERSEVA